MAFDVMITGIAKYTGKMLLELNPVIWWDRDELMNDDRFTITNESGSYFDHDADFTVEGMRALHEHYRAAATSGVYGEKEWQESIAPMIKELDEALYRQTDQYDHVHVLVYEWETGM